MAKFWETKFGVVLRWILMPFAVVIGSTLLYVILVYWFGLQHRISPYTNTVELTDFSKLLLDATARFMYGFTFVLFGVLTAPNNRRVLSIVLATLMGVICVSALILVVIDKLSWLNLISIASALSGAIFAVTYTSENFE